MNKYLIIAVYALFVSLYGNAATAAVASVAENPFMHQESQDHPHSSLEIHNGDEVPSFSSVPFMARIEMRDFLNTTSSCGAVFVKSNYLLTAAHCMFDRNHKKYKKEKILVIYGGVDLNNQSDFTVKKIEGYYVYPEFVPEWTKNINAATNSGDVAVIKIKNNFNPNVKPLEIMEGIPAYLYLQPGALLDTYGWGKIAYKSNDTSKKLMHIQVELVDKFTVESILSVQKLNPRRFNSDEMIGVVSSSGKVTDVGDSGGPLVAPCHEIQRCLVGTTSWGPNDGELSIFTDYSTSQTGMTAWVKKQINK